MSRRVFTVIICIVFVFILIVGYIGVTYNNSGQSTPDQSAQTARDSAISYIRENYPVTENITSNLSWTGGRQNTSSPDTEFYIYNATDWYMLLNCSSTASFPVYIVDANYTRGDVTIEWMGFCQNSTVIEQGYIVYDIDFETTPVQQARQDLFGSFFESHSEAFQYLNFAGWEGGRATPEGLVGSETYRYYGVMYNGTSIYPTGWTMTIQYPVVPNPVYSANITYNPPGTTQKIIDWQGTCQNGAVIEAFYSYTPSF